MRNQEVMSSSPEKESFLSVLLGLMGIQSKLKRVISENIWVDVKLRNHTISIPQSTQATRAMA